MTLRDKIRPERILEAVARSGEYVLCLVFWPGHPTDNTEVQVHSDLIEKFYEEI